MKVWVRVKESTGRSAHAYKGFAMSTPKRNNTESPVPVNTVCCLLSTLRRAPAPEQGGGRTTPYSLAARTPSGPCKPHRTQSHPHRSHTYDRLFLLPPPTLAQTTPSWLVNTTGGAFAPPSHDRHHKLGPGTFRTRRWRGPSRGRGGRGRLWLFGLWWWGWADGGDETMT